jgi:hypothetical protein
VPVGSVLVAGLGGQAVWQSLSANHVHAGDTPDSVVVGQTDPTDYLDDQVWVGFGAGAAADQGTGAIALGYGARVHDNDAVAAGNAATASDSAVAAGAGAVSSGGAVALGAVAQASAQQTSLNASQVSTEADAVLLGTNTPAGALESLNGLVVINPDGSVRIGPSGTPPDASQLSAAPTTWWIVNGMTVFGAGFTWFKKGGMVGGNAGTAGFYGAPGITQPTVDGSSLTTSAPGYPALISLLRALNSMGLINLTGIS